MNLFQKMDPKSPTTPQITLEKNSTLIEVSHRKGGIKTKSIESLRGVGHLEVGAKKNTETETLEPAHAAEK